MESTANLLRADPPSSAARFGVKLCPTCGTRFLARWQTHKYCQKTCWASERRKRKTAKHTTCAGCGTPILTTRDWQRWCPQCRPKGGRGLARPGMLI